MGEGVYLGQLQAFLEVARLGNVTRAADSLFLTQSALSARLRRLEQEIGISLLVRDHRGARLTDAGAAFLPYASTVVTTLAEGARVVADAELERGGDFTLAATSTLSTYVLPPVVATFAARDPAVRISLHTAASEDIVAMVVRGDVHLGLGRLLHHRDVESVALFDEEFVLAVGAHHRLAGGCTMCVRDLAGETIVTMLRSESYRTYVRDLLQRGGAVKHIDVDNSEAAKQIVLECSAVGLLPRTSVIDDEADGRLSIVSIADAAPMIRTIAAVRRNDAPGGSTAERFVSILERHLREVGLTGFEMKRRGV